MKAVVPVAAILAAVTGGLYFLKGQVGRPGAEAGAEIKVGSILPDFELKPYDGGPARKLSQLGAKVVMVNFWATWCEACMVELPSIVEAREKYHARGFEVLAIDVDENPAAVVPKVAARLGMKFPILTDPEGELAELFDVHAIPLTVVAGKDRKVLYMESGERDWSADDARAQLEKWLGEAGG
jgi:peroxiredoxin